MDIKEQLKQLRSEIDTLYKKESCECGKTLCLSKDDFIYIKCRGCGKIKTYLLAKHK